MLQITPKPPQPKIYPQHLVDPSLDKRLATSPRALVVKTSSSDFSLLLRLPAELRTKVMMLLPDLATLQRLIWASNVYEATFTADAVRIVSVIASGLTLEMRSLIYDLTMSNIIDDDQLLRESHPKVLMDGYGRGQRWSLLDDKFGTFQIAATYPVARLRRTVLLSYWVERKADDFLDYHLDLLNRLKIEHLKGVRHYFSDIRGRDDRTVDELAQGVPCAFPKNGPVSWSERYRVEVSFWRALSRTCMKLGVHYEVISNRMWHSECWRLDMATDVTDYLDDLGRIRAYKDKDFKALENQLLDLVEQPVIRKAGVPLNQHQLDKFPCDELSRVWDQDRSSVQKSTRAFRFYCRISRGIPRTFGGEPLSWNVYRHLGFAFWDLKRMYAMGLYSESMEEHGPDEYAAFRRDANIHIEDFEQGIFAWVSIKLNGKRVLAHQWPHRNMSHSYWYEQW